jgi:hypothetical protein
MKLVIKVPEASRVSGIPEQKIRYLLRLGCDWGEAIRKKKKTRSGNPSFIYIIFKEKFMQWLGITEWPE